MSNTEGGRVNKIYLGDSVYAEQDGTDLVLTTENGVRVSNRIVLEIQVLNALCQYLQLERKAKEADAGE